MTDSSPLSSLKFHSVDQLCNPIHRNNTLNILLFQETVLCNLKFLVVLNILGKSFAFLLTKLTETAASFHKNSDE